MKIKDFEFNLFGVNTYVVWDDVSRQAAIVDPGMTGVAETDALDMFIEANRLQVTHLLFTHLHLDHTFGADYVMERYGVGVEASAADAFLGQQRDAQAQMFHQPQRPGPLGITTELHEGDIITFGSDRLLVFAVPGHSPGGLVFYNERDRWVITGDVLFRGSIGRTDLPGGSHGALVRGIGEKLLVLPPDTTVYPGHGPATTIGAEMRSNPYLR